MLKQLLILFLFFFFSFGFSQATLKLSDFSEISIVTSGPGEALYEKFGHTAIRVKDPMLQLDLIYNYGIFDFDGPNFYLNFTRGFMKYKLARYPFHYSLRSAREDQRWMKQQVLNLTNQEKNEFFNFLETNASPKNASYFYDPFFNNCATKPRDIITEILNNKITWSNDYTSEASLRELMNYEIPQNTWGSLGINIALGNKLDKKATSFEYLYLPDYVEKALNSATITRNNKPEKLVSKTTILLDFTEKTTQISSVNPFLMFCGVMLLGIFITYKDYKNKKRTKWLDFILFFSTGLIGILIIFLWFFTNHSTAPNNFNILWGFPINLIASFYALKYTSKTKKLLSKYALFTLVLVFIGFIVWIMKIQIFNWVLSPLLLLLSVRYLFIYKTLKS